MSYLQLHDQGVGCHIIEEVSPTGERLEPPCVFEAPESWYRRRSDNDWIEPIPKESYWQATWRGESASHAPEDVPELYRVDEAGRSTAEPDSPELTEPSKADKVEAARDRLEAHEDELRADLPDEEPAEDAPMAERIVWALLKGGYQDRRSVVADVSDESAMQGNEALREILLAALYDREMAE